MKKRKMTVRARQMQVAGRLRNGESIEAIAAALGVTAETVHRDVTALRAQAGRRNPWAVPHDCAAAFIEEAQHVLQKVRAVQNELDHDTTAYHNFVKLEWTILVKFIEMNRKQTESNSEEQEDDNPFTKFSDEEVFDMARKLGLDVAQLEPLCRPDNRDVGAAA
jgi:transposase-like protein